MVDPLFRKVHAIGQCLYVRSMMEVKLDQARINLSSDKIKEAEEKIECLKDVEAFIHEAYDALEKARSGASKLHGTTLQQALEIRELKKDNEKMSNTLKQFIL